MRPFPLALPEQIEYLEACTARWAVTPPPGVPPEVVAELAGKIAETTRARVAAEQAKEAVKSTTRSLQSARLAMVTLGKAVLEAEAAASGGSAPPPTATEGGDAAEGSVPAGTGGGALGLTAAVAVQIEPKPLHEAPDLPTFVRTAVSPRGDVTVTWTAQRVGPGSGVYFEVRRALVEGPGAGPESVRVFITADTRIVDLADAYANPEPPPVAEGTLAYQVRAVKGSGASARMSNWTALYVARPAA
jgi:hypothetical protein